LSLQSISMIYDYIPILIWRQVAVLVLSHPQDRAFSIFFVFFRKETCVLFSNRVKIPLRKEKRLSSETGLDFRRESKKERFVMKNNNQINIPQAREAMDKFKMQAASEVGVNLTNGYNGHLTSREAGSVGGQMVKKMVEAYEQGLQ